MSIYGAMLSGVSGLFSQSSQMSAISDNIANANTVGYKRTDVPFSTMVTTQGLKHSYAAGGVRANPRMHVDQQGQMQSTQSTTDLAINGSGFFVVNTSAEPITGNIANRTLFTRAGSFTPDANGDLRNTAGLYLQGWKLDSGGEFLNGEPARTSFASLETVNVTGLNFTGAPTTQVTFAGNLPAGETGTDIPGEPIVTGVEYFDPLGNPQTMNMQWTPGTDYGSWTLDLVPAGEQVPLASYQIDFNTSGPDSGTPASIVEVPSIVGSRNATTIGNDNPNSYAGDVVTFDFSGLAPGGSPGSWTGTGASPADDVTINIGGDTVVLTLDAADVANDAALAQAVTDAIQAQIGGTLSDVASVSRSGNSVVVTGIDGKGGAEIIDIGPPTIQHNTATEDPVRTDTTDNPHLLVADVIEIDVAGGASNWLPGDIASIEIGGHSFTHTLTSADLADDNALATNLAAAINAEAGNIDGYSAGNLTITGSRIRITGDADSVDGSSLAGGAGAIGALEITRDTTTASQFVDEDGLPVTPSAQGDPIIVQIAATLPGGETQTLDFDLGEIGTLDGMTQFAGDYTPTLIERDGAQFGSLDRLEINEEGVMTAIFNNGQTRPIYRIPIAEFTNPNGLLPVDGNAFQPTAQAGAHYLWDAGNGPAGEMVSSSLESSTVDIAEEFSNMIIAQRAYSSNARIIQTADEMLQEITNLKR